MRHARYTPHPLLRKYVKYLWTSERDFQPPRDTLELLPDGTVELVFSYGGECRIDGGPSTYDLSRGYVIGLLDRPVRLRANGLVRSVAARFFAWGFVPLLQVEPIPGASVLRLPDPAWEVLTKAIAGALECDDGDAAVRMLHSWLIARVRQVAPTRCLTEGDTRWLAQQGGRVRIARWAERFQCSPRQLERYVKALTGITPKSLARRLRFEQVPDHLARDPKAELATLAQEYGYADQAHLTHEFRYFAARTPGQFAREMAALHEVMGTVYNVVFLQDLVESAPYDGTEPAAACEEGEPP